jgi:dipeptidyl aminopeptidase/acylaminoacyl peptidase
MSDMLKAVLSGLLPLLLALELLAEDTYRKPSREILDVLNAPPTPDVIVNPSGTEALLVERILYPPVADLARPMARLAGFRIDTRNNGPHSASLFRSIELRSLSAGGRAMKVTLPPGAKITPPVWSPDGTRFAFMNVADTSVELWLGDTAGRVRKNFVVRVNAALYSPRGTPPIQWLPDSKTLLVETVPGDRGEAPPEPIVPLGPHTQETLGKAGPAPTYEDLLKNSRDEDLFDYYATSQLALVNSESGNASTLGKPGVFTSVAGSPDGQDADSSGAKTVFILSSAVRLRQRSRGLGPLRQGGLQSCQPAGCRSRSH